MATAEMPVPLQPTAEHLYVQVSNLPADQRRLVVELLVADHEAVTSISPEFRAELDRRWERYKSGESKGSSVEAVIARARRDIIDRG